MRVIGTLQHAQDALRRNQKFLGVWQGTRWFVLHGLNKRWLLKAPRIRIQPPALDHSVELRMQDSSDPHVFRQVFVDGEYSFIEHLSNIRTVIDLGANIGLASALFLSRWPESLVISVEPDPGNEALLRKNLAPYGKRSICVKGAVWSESGAVVLSPGTFGDGREWATEVRSVGPEETAGDVRAYDVPELIALTGAKTIDLLKIDIEGSERDLFSRNTDWLDCVRNLSIELHGPECERVFREGLRGYRWKESYCGEYIVCEDLKRV